MLGINFCSFLPCILLFFRISLWFEAQDSDEICIKLMGYVDTVIAVGCYWIKKLIDVSLNSEFSEFLHKKVTEDI